MTDKTRSTVAILQESLDTIKATFWIKGDEYRFADVAQEIEKKIDAQLSDDFTWDTYKVTGEGKAKITGVCSIGALALATYTLYDEPVESFNTVANRDPLTWAAAAAVVAVISEKDPHWLYEHDDLASVIAAWNDADNREREDVIAVFEEAMKHPIATAKDIYAIKWRFNGSTYDSYDSTFVFATKEATDAFIAEINKAKHADDLDGFDGLVVAWADRYGTPDTMEAYMVRSTELVSA